MADSNDQKAVVFVTKGGLQFFSTGSKNIVTLPFDASVVKDLDVVDGKKLVFQIHAFVDQNKLAPCPVIYLFSEPSCYYQDFKETDHNKVKVLAQDFVNVVPFETVLTKVYKIKDGTRIVSINEKLYREIASAFEAKNFLSLGVIPSFILGGKQALASSLDFNLGRQTLANLEGLREQSFFASMSEENENDEEKPSGKPVVQTGFKITRNAVLLGMFFLVALGILIFLVVRS